MRRVHQAMTLVLLSIGLCLARAHTSLEKYIQHRFTLDAGKQYINLGIEIAFNAPDS
jgi:hypothetical protein